MPKCWGKIFTSLSARRAWIEISPVPMEITMPGVALRKESVDRNKGIIHFCDSGFKSLSARRAWIEISARLQSRYCWVVALRKESVDRN